MKHYDVFISYRRNSYDTANLISTRLKAEGYSVFFDMETLRSGKFNEQLFEVIDNCKDFILVLPPQALDRCVNEDDWVRMEVIRAMEAKKNIIPVMLNGFVWPDPMPEGMEELAYYQALTASSVEYFDLAMERLQQKYLTSRRHMPMKRFMKGAGIVCGVLVVAFAILLSVFSFLSKDVCARYATCLAKDAGSVHMLAEENHDLMQDWNRFNELLNYESRQDRISPAQSDMLDRIDLTEKNLKQCWMSDSLKLDISDYHGFLLSLHGINAEEMALSPAIATMYYTDYLDQLDIIRDAVIDPTTMNRRFVTALFEVQEHSFNSYYASVLCELAAFPENSLTTYNELSKHWIYFPVYSFGESRVYYENIINNESALVDEILSRYGRDLEQRDADIEDLFRKNDQLDAQLNAELAKLNDRNDELYASLKETCTFSGNDDQWVKWSKVRVWGSFIYLLAEERRDLMEEGIQVSSSITPEQAFSEMKNMLHQYQSSYPEAVSYVKSAQQFYHEISKGTLDYAGVIIFAMKDGLEHPFFKVGDIVTKYNDAGIVSYEDLKSEYQSDKNGTVTFLRLAGERFEEFTKPISDVDIIGFLELTEPEY